MEEVQLLFRRLVLLFSSLFALVVVLFIGMFYYSPDAAPPINETLIEHSTLWLPKNVLYELSSMPPLVKQGYFLITETSNNIGPLVIDTNKQFTGNNLACTNCHLKSGTQAGSASWVGVTDRFPQFGGRSNTIGTIEDRINGCIERSMNGKKLPLESKELKAIVAYMEWLGEGLPANRKKEFKGYAPIVIPNTAVNLEKGKVVYTKECALCHKENGQGIRHADTSKGYQYPPLWGADSYNDGAGMNRVITSAEFIKGNMPFGQATWDNPKLTDEQAFNVAGYINSFDRPRKKNTENDYPDKKLKPVSTPYGPWVDNFSKEQHKYGPFLPIIAHYKEEYGIIKTK
ncbi:MAG: thiosulfate dehydrogenase [Maribacter sp.]|jgi:thiosulfate dehydrogenase